MPYRSIAGQPTDHDFGRAHDTPRIEPVFEIDWLVPDRPSELEESGTAAGAAQLVQR